MAAGDTFLLLAALLAGIVILSLAMLRGWEDWLRLRRLELDDGAARPRAAARRRLELIDLRDRVKRLEAIADGMED